MTVPMTVIIIWVSDAEGVRIFFVHTIVNTKPSVDNNNCPLPKKCNILFTKNFQFFKALHFPSFCILFYFFIFTLKMFNAPIAFSFVPVLLDLLGRKLVSCLLFVNVVNSVRSGLTLLRMIHFQFFHVQFSSGIIRLERRTKFQSRYPLGM